MDVAETRGGAFPHVGHEEFHVFAVRGVQDSDDVRRDALDDTAARGRYPVSRE